MRSRRGRSNHWPQTLMGGESRGRGWRSQVCVKISGRHTPSPHDSSYPKPYLPKESVFRIYPIPIREGVVPCHFSLQMVLDRTFTNSVSHPLLSADSPSCPPPPLLTTRPDHSSPSHPPSTAPHLAPPGLGERTLAPAWKMSQPDCQRSHWHLQPPEQSKYPPSPRASPGLDPYTPKVAEPSGPIPPSCPTPLAALSYMRSAKGNSSLDAAVHATT